METTTDEVIGGTAEAARFTGRSRRTIRRYVERGLLPKRMPAGAGAYVFYRRDVEALMRPRTSRVAPKRVGKTGGR